MPLAQTAVLTSLVILLLIVLQRQRQSRGRRLPPGPPAEFLLGHARVFPRENIQHGLAQLAKQYGDVMHFNVLGKNIVVLSSQTATTELLDRRGNLYSSRPRFAMFELTGWSYQYPFAPYDKEYIRSQKLAHNAFNARQVTTYQPVQLKHARALIRNLLTAPQDLSTHVARFSSSIIIELTYGPNMASGAQLERMIELNERITRNLAAMGDPSFIDLMPFLIYLPSWLPGLGCLKIARETWNIQQEREHVPFNELRLKVAEGKAYPAMLAGHLEKLEREKPTNEEDLTRLRVFAIATIGAGAETTWSTVMNFVAAMLMFPHIQTKAQEEVDRVIGRDRLPDFSDRDSLPYIQGILYETLRWQPPVPLAIPHFTTEDDVYNDMFIPKGTRIIANAYAMANDERVYKNPEQFLPERYLPDRNEPVPANIAYGHGRRICPGRHLADANVWIAIASLLTMFDIRRSLNSEGKEVEPDITFTHSFTSNPKPFNYRLIPRNKELAGMIDTQ